MKLGRIRAQRGLSHSLIIRGPLSSNFCRERILNEFCFSFYLRLGQHAKRMKQKQKKTNEKIEETKKNKQTNNRVGGERKNANYFARSISHTHSHTPSRSSFKDIYLILHGFLSRSRASIYIVHYCWIRYIARERKKTRAGEGKSFFRAGEIKYNLSSRRHFD